MDTSTLPLGIVQTSSTDDLQANLHSVSEQVASLAQQGAQMVALPENFAVFGQVERLSGDPQQHTRLLALQQQLQQFLAALAQQHHLWLIGGTLPIYDSGDPRPYASCLAYNPTGQCVARYNKIHLFDADVADTQQQYRESQLFCPGRDPVVMNTPWGVIGLAVCYDLRFPELFRIMRLQGAQCFIIPSAFTYTTGQAHWQVLCRARAIENGCYVIAPNQCGHHDDTRHSYGHSCIIDPWGHPLASLADQPGTLQTCLDFQHLQQIRSQLPSFANRRLSLGGEYSGD